MYKRGKILWRASLLLGSMVLVFLCSSQGASAANNDPTAPSSTSNFTTNTIRFNWTSGAGGETNYIEEQSFDGVTFTSSSETSAATPYYDFTGLSVNKLYIFRVAAVDHAAAASGYFYSAPTYSSANPALPPTVTSASTTALQVVINGNGNPAASTTFAIYNLSTGQYLTAAGAGTVTPTFFTSSSWTGTATGLLVNTPYQFAVVSVNGAGTSTATSSPSAAVYTLSNPALAPTVSGATTSTLNLLLNTNSNPASSTYAIFNNTSGQYVTAAGTATTTPTFFASSSWTGVVTGLSLNTSYQFGVVARNGDNVNAVTSSLSTAIYTLAATPAAPSVSAASSTSLTIVINGNGNPSTTNYAIFNSTTAQYLTAGGTSTATPTFFASSSWTGAATGLSVNTSYQFALIARNGDSVSTATSSLSTAAYTLANQALVPSVSLGTTSTLNLVLNTNSNPVSTTYAVYNSTTGQYVSATGTATMTPTFFASSTWGGVVNGLSLNTAYQFGVIAQNGNSVNAATSSLNTALYTLANPATAVTATSTASTTMAIQFGTNGNSMSTLYALYNVTSASYLNASGAVTSTPVFQASSTWGSVITATGLTVNTPYQFGVIAQNGNSVNAATSTAASIYTLATVPTAPTSTVMTSDGLTVTWTGNATQYYLENMSNATNTGWISGTYAGLSGLGCNASYLFRVKGRNGDGTETGFSTSTLLFTGACAAGSGGTVSIGGGGSSGGSSGGGSYSPAPVSTPTPSLPVSSGMTIDQLYKMGQTPFIPQPEEKPVLATIAFFNRPAGTVKTGSSFSFRYTVTNTTTASRSVRVERTLLNPKGLVLSRSSLLINQRAGQVFTSIPKTILGKAIPLGTYTVRIRVLNNKGAVLASDSFGVATRR